MVLTARARREHHAVHGRGHARTTARRRMDAQRTHRPRARGTGTHRRRAIERSIAAKRFLSRKTTESHISQIFVKLDLRDSPVGHRRVLAALTYLRST